MSRRGGESTSQRGLTLVDRNLLWSGLTPELRRTDLRPCVSEDHSGLHEAAKRSRLERIVSATPYLEPQLSVAMIRVTC